MYKTKRYYKKSLNKRLNRRKKRTKKFYLKLQKGRGRDSSSSSALASDFTPESYRSKLSIINEEVSKVRREAMENKGNESIFSRLMDNLENLLWKKWNIQDQLETYNKSIATVHQHDNVTDAEIEWE